MCPFSRRPLWIRLALALSLLGACRGNAEIRVLTPPLSPLSTSQRIAGLRESDFLPRTVQEDLAQLGPLGRSILACAKNQTILVAYLHSQEAPEAVLTALEEQGYPDWASLTAGSPTARWVQGKDGGLFLVRIDQLLQERGAGATSTLPGLLAHELTHLGQRCWGSLDSAALFHDQRDEAEAHLTEILVNQRVIRRKRRRGIRPSRAEIQLLGIRPDGKALHGLLQRVARHPRYQQLSPEALRDQARYRRENDPFALLWDTP